MSETFHRSNTPQHNWLIAQHLPRLVLTHRHRGSSYRQVSERTFPFVHGRPRGDQKVCCLLLQLLQALPHLPENSAQRPVNRLRDLAERQPRKESQHHQLAFIVRQRLNQRRNRPWNYRSKPPRNCRSNLPGMRPRYLLPKRRPKHHWNSYPMVTKYRNGSVTRQWRN